MSEELPAHLLGDPLQGIFDFAQPIVDFEKDLLSFNRYDFLQTPWRWKRLGNGKLGQLILGMRESLLNERSISLYNRQNEMFALRKTKCEIHNKNEMRLFFFAKTRQKPLAVVLKCT